MPLTPYTTNIPLSNQPINQTQQAINDNFTCLVNNATPANGLITVNHVGTNDPLNYGKHNFVEFPAAPPTNVTTAGEIALYSNNGSASGVPELFVQKQSLGANAGYSFTEATSSTNGWTRLPSGIILKWGQEPMPSGGSGSENPDVVFPAGGGVPAFTQIFQIMMGQRWTNNQTSLGSNGFGLYALITAGSNITGFKVTWSGNNSSGTILTYLAIGI